MQRKVELFLHQGIITSQPKAPENNSASGRWGMIAIQNPFDKKDEKTLTVFTHYQHSFTKEGQGPEVGTTVYFFLVPYEYIGDKAGNPGEMDAMVAVNVSEGRPFMQFAEGAVNRHPCGTLLTIASDPTNSFYQYCINDYGELFILHTKEWLAPWTKIIAKGLPDTRDPKDKNHYRKCSPKLGKEHPITSELLLLDFFSLDKDWEWNFVQTEVLQV